MKRFLVAALLLGLAASAEARSRRLALYTPWVADVVRAIPPVAGSSSSSGLAAGTSAISGCADTLVLYNDANFLGCDAGLAYNESANRLTADAFAVRDGFDQSHVMSIIHLANLTADRTLTFNTGDAARTITLGGNLTTVGDNLFNDTAFLIRDPTNTSRQLDFDINTASDFVATLAFASDASTLALSTPDRTRFGFTNAVVGVGSASYLSLNVTGASDAYPAFKFLGDFTPDVPAFIVDDVSMSLHILQRGDEGVNLGNGPCGAAVCTNPQLVVHDKDQNTTNFQALGLSGVSGSFIKTLTSATPTSVVIIPVPDDVSVSGMMLYTVHARDSTNAQTRSGRIIYNGVAEGTTATCVVGTAEELDNTPTGTLTAAITCTSPANNQIQLLINADSSLTETTLEAYVTVFHVGAGEPIPQ